MVILLLIYLVYISVWDIRRREIPTGMLLGGMAIGIIYSVMKGEAWSLFLGSIPGVLLLLLGFLTREKVGYGDGILVIIIGFVLGWPGSFVVYVVAQFAVLFYAVFLLVTKHISREAKIPFAPFLAAAVAIYQLGIV